MTFFYAYKIFKKTFYRPSLRFLWTCYDMYIYQWLSVLFCFIFCTLTSDFFLFPRFGWRLVFRCFTHLVLRGAASSQCQVLINLTTTVLGKYFTSLFFSFTYNHFFRYIVNSEKINIDNCRIRLQIEITRKYLSH